MSKSTRPRKPRKDFPLSIHKGSGYWCKKVRGRVYYFGKVEDDPKGQSALEEWLKIKDDLLAGRTPRKKNGDLTVAQLCNAFLTSKADARDSGELSPRTFETYYRTCGLLVKHLGKGRLVSDLHPEDFAALRKCLSKRLGMVALGNDITRVRSVFGFAIAFDLMDTPIRFGPDFKRPTKVTVKKERQAHRLENGKMMLEAIELRQILATAKQPLKAMILLGVNTGFGNTDMASLPIQAVDLETAWVDFPRPNPLCQYD